MHVALGLFGTKRINFLRVAGCAQGGDGHNLCLPALEKAGAVYTGNNANFGCEWTNIGQTTSVRTNAFVYDAATGFFGNNFTKGVAGITDFDLFIGISEAFV